MEERYILPSQSVVILGQVEDIIGIDGNIIRILNPVCTACTYCMCLSILLYARRLIQLFHKL